MKPFPTTQRARLPCASLGSGLALALHIRFQPSQPSLRGSSTGLLTHVPSIDARPALFPCYSSRFCRACLVFGNRISRPPRVQHVHEFASVARQTRRCPNSRNGSTEFIIYSAVPLFISGYHTIFLSRQKYNSIHLPRK